MIEYDASDRKYPHLLILLVLSAQSSLTLTGLKGVVRLRHKLRQEAASMISMNIVLGIGASCMHHSLGDDSMGEEHKSRRCGQRHHRTSLGILV